MIDCESERPNEFPQVLRVRSHSFRADVPPAVGGGDTAPDPHDYFDASLAACKATTALWYAKAHGIPLERVEAHVERDTTKERQGTYKLQVRLVFHGPLDAAQRKRLHDAVARCPIHKLMTTATVEVDTLPMEEP